MTDESALLRSQILLHEHQALPLEPSSELRDGMRRQVIEYTEEFLDQIEHLKAYTVTEDKGIALLDSPIGEDPIAINQAIRLIRQNVDRPGLNPASGGHLGYIPGGGIYLSALADYMADITNRYAGVFFAGPGAVRMENMLLRWMCGLIGYPATASGNLTSGGSVANLIAVVTARDARKVRPRDVERSEVYCSGQAHHSIDKALRIAGLGECPLRRIPVDKAYRMDPAALEAQILHDAADGLNPFLVIASAGTTDTGAIDPLERIGEITARQGLWYHVDAAYGGFFILTDEGKDKLKGIGTSDSLSIDPHKGLFLPYGSGMILIRDKSALQASHYYTANYMQDALESVDEDSPSELSPELTKHFRGLRMWLPLKLLGLKPFRACLEEKLLLAKYFHRRVRELGFEAGPEPELSVVTYRYVPRQGQADEFNKQLVAAVMQDGRVFISSTMLDGVYTLRLAVLSFRTHLHTIDLLLDILGQTVHKLEMAFPIQQRTS